MISSLGNHYQRSSGTEEEPGRKERLLDECDRVAKSTGTMIPKHSIGYRQTHKLLPASETQILLWVNCVTKKDAWSSALSLAWRARRVNLSFYIGLNVRFHHTFLRVRNAIQRRLSCPSPDPTPLCAPLLGKILAGRHGHAPLRRLRLLPRAPRRRLSQGGSFRYCRRLQRVANRQSTTARTRSE